MMPTIRVDDDVMQGLKELAEPFVDTPNSVIKRLLEIAKSSKGDIERSATPPSKPSQRRAARGSLTPQSTYEVFLLHVLGKLDGTANKADVTRSVIDEMKPRGFITAAELERVSSGETRAENTIAWARNALKDRGLISADSRKGVWQLTPAGVKKAQHVVLPRR